MNAIGETAIFARWAHPRGGRLHWRRAGEEAALCGARVAAPGAWHAPPLPVDLLRVCGECNAAVEACVRDALTCSVVLPGVPATAGR